MVEYLYQFMYKEGSGAMLSLNYRDARPIYEQVRDGLRHLVVTGAIIEGEPLPTAEVLAANLAINPNTIRRAYGALAEEGYITQIPGGAPTAAQGPAADAVRREVLLRQFDDTARELRFLGMTAEELARRLGGDTKTQDREMPGGKPRLSVTVKLRTKGKEEKQ